MKNEKLRWEDGKMICGDWKCKQLVYSSTCLLVNLSTRLLVN